MEIDNRLCSRCQNSKPRTDVRDGEDWWWCAKHRTFITEATRPSWIVGCKGKDYKEP